MGNSDHDTLYERVGRDDGELRRKLKPAAAKEAGGRDHAGALI